ncbi:MAG: hypothetical protein LBJ47_05260 [Tannerella sp.]|jgi:hypothetical protein|nr:hypothetical protein [Tannerella sp.]
MKFKGLFLCLSILSLFAATGCNRDDEDVLEAEGNMPYAQLTDSEKINKFIVDCTQDVYLWESLTDWTKYNNYDTYRNHADHYALFGGFLYADDRWSELTNDIDSWKSSLQAVSTTYGYTLIFVKFSNMDRYFAIVLYVCAGAPAEKAGMKRGDIIVGMNGGDITESNYTDLYYLPSISLQMGYVDGNGFSLKPGSVSMVAVGMYENPVNTFRIIEKNGHRIGYLCYTAYVDASRDELLDVFARFKAGGVTDVVLDLRYNGGGHASTARFLSSILAPVAAVKNRDVYLTQKWNDFYSRDPSSGEIVDNSEYFIDTLSVNMNLNRLHVLVSEHTASASEATIIGLKPYMDVVLVGDTTHGKYYGGYVLSVDDYYYAFYYGDSRGYNKEHYLNISNWGMYVMTYRYANRNNYPDFSGGLAPEPDMLMLPEDYFDLKPFGDETDPLLAKALERITGEKYVPVRSSAAENMPPYTVFPEMGGGNAAKKNLIHSAPQPRP